MIAEYSSSAVRVYRRDENGVLLPARIRVRKWEYTGPTFAGPGEARDFLAKHDTAGYQYVLLPVHRP